MSIWAVVPVNDFTRAKSRLAGALEAGARYSFARKLFEHVLDVLGESSRIDGVLVLTPSAEVAHLARGRGARVRLDPPGRRPLGWLVDAALVDLHEREVGAALVLMCDLPQLRLADVDEMLDRFETHDVVLAPDRLDLGTNALAVRLPATTATSFGHTDSFGRHIAGAISGRLGVVRSMGLGLDVDSPEDLALLPAPPRAGSETVPWLLRA
jgi:2-phospho-L-lactate guanylyltransferase